ncbi:hypothetical protein [Actinomyces sp.]|uniref:hypothetical protein n=1 Tax=Actinomyces sp. TaxID=29317 RepID=UPI0034C69680
MSPASGPVVPFAAVAGRRRRALACRMPLLLAGHDHVHTHARVLREAVLGAQDPDLP